LAAAKKRYNPIAFCSGAFLPETKKNGGMFSNPVALRSSNDYHSCNKHLSMPFQGGCHEFEHSTTAVGVSDCQDG
jgi:hypothetical protein